jgi:DNA mismatch endonuclease (patch repair protein)
MADVLNPEQRRFNMSRIQGRDTKPEMFLRRGLHSRGLRFRLHRRDLPGRPDLVFPLHRAIIFAHGCFWHDHRCALCKTPATRPDFWMSKIARNAERDQQAIAALVRTGWRVLVVWECAMRGPGRLSSDEVLNQCETFVRNPDTSLKEITGWAG